jgi:hypothetical protein
MDEVASLLWAYLTEGTRGGRLESMYAEVIKRIWGELQIH